MINKRGQGGLGITIMITLVFFIVGLTFMNFIAPEVTDSRASDALDCANASAISDGNKLLCLAVDLTVPYFILLVFSTAGGYIIGRFLI